MGWTMIILTIFLIKNMDGNEADCIRATGNREHSVQKDGKPELKVDFYLVKNLDGNKLTVTARLEIGSKVSNSMENQNCLQTEIT